MDKEAMMNQLQKEYNEQTKIYNKKVEETEILRERINELDKVIKSLKKILESERNPTKPKINENSSFDEVIIYFLEEENYPLTSKQLQDRYNEYFDENRKNKGTFSGMMSHIFYKTKTVSRTKLSNSKVRSAYIYGLPEWFDGDGNLKQEYIDRMKQESDIFRK